MKLTEITLKYIIFPQVIFQNVFSNFTSTSNFCCSDSLLALCTARSLSLCYRCSRSCKEVCTTVLIYMLVITKEIEHLFKALVAIILTICIFVKVFYKIVKSWWVRKSKSWVNHRKFQRYHFTKGTLLNSNSLQC